MKACSRLIVGLGGLKLTPSEKGLLKTINPLGIILFARNLDHKEQLKALISSCKEVTENASLLVMIDQEGGRVQRLRPPLAQDFPAARQIGLCAARNSELGHEMAFLHGRLLAHELTAYGINVNCLPCLDLGLEETHPAIGDRALSGDPERVASLGRELCNGLLAGGMLPVAKHVPGHGRAGADSHRQLPRVTTPRSTLSKTDFLPFRALRDLPAMMTSHLIYEAIDPRRPATTSPDLVNEIIRGEIGFDGLLFSDDLSMAALSGSLVARVEKSWAAGIDVALYCRGKLPHLRLLAEKARPLDGKTAERAARLRDFVHKKPLLLDVPAAKARYSWLRKFSEALE